MINQTDIYIRTHLLNVIHEQIEMSATLALGVVQTKGYAEKRRKYIAGLENFIGTKLIWKDGENEHTQRSTPT